MSSQLNLPNLRELDLYSVNIEQVMIESIIMKCTSILTLRLELCRGFNSLRISGIPALKDLYLCDNLELTMTEIDAPNLEELHYEPTEIFNLVLTAKSFRMRYLELSHSEVISPSDWIRSNISTHLSHIKELVLHGSNVLEHIARTGIEMACLERLEIGSQQGPLSPDMGQIRLQSFCVNLKHLELEYYRSDVTDDWLNQQIAQLTNLESLKIKSFNSVVHLIICHMRLTTLSLLHLEKLEKVDIDCPNLRTFSYDVSYRETIMSLTTASSELTALTFCEIFLGSTKLPSDKVLQLLEKLKHSRYMTLHVFDQNLQDIVNWRRMKDSFRIHRPPLSEANISLQLVFPKCTLSKQQVDNIFESLLRLCPQPHVIRLQSYSTSTVEYNYEDETVLENLVVGCSCFDSCLGRCWQHSCISNEIIEEPVSEIVAERTGFGTGEPSNKRKADVDCYPSSLKHLKH